MRNRLTRKLISLTGYQNGDVYFIFVCMRYGGFLLTLLLSILWHVSAFAQDPYHMVINKSSGLPSNTVYDIFQDKKGFIWAATDAGLTRYDGAEFTTYLSEKQTSRAGDDIKEDQYGRIWYKNFDGYLYYVADDTLRSLAQNTTLGNLAFAIIADHVLVLQTKGIDIFDLRTLKLLKTVPFNFSNLTSVLQYNNHYYLLTNNTLFTISADGNIKQQPVSVSGGLAGSGNGLLIVQKNNITGYCYELLNKEIKKKIPTPGIRFIQGANYCGGYYWLFTTSGVWVYDESGNNINGNAPFFLSKNTSCVLTDKEGNFWLGTIDGGIFLIPDLKSKIVDLDGATPTVLFPVKQDIYIGTSDNRIFSYNVASGKIHQRYKGDIRHNVICLLADTANQRFLFSSSDLAITDPEFRARKNYTFAVKDLCAVDNKYHAFAATGIGGLIKMREDIPSRWDSFFNATELSTFRGFGELIRAGRCKTVTYEQQTNMIYIGSNNGLYRITPTAAEEVKYNDESLYIRKLVSYRGDIYVMVSQDLLYVISKNRKIKQLTPSDEKERFISIKKTGGGLYLTSSKGLKILDTASGNFTLANNQHVTISEMNDMEIQGQNIFIASDKGLIVMDWQQAAYVPPVPGFTINRLLVNGRKLNPQQPAHLAYKENDIEITYSILSYTNHYDLLYRINDGAWQRAGSTLRTLKLASLAPGAYHISFQLTNDNGGIFPQQPVSFTISKPAWAEWWFLAAIAAILGTIGYAYYKWRTFLLKKENALVLEKVELEKNLRNSMLTSIRAQMNPHFFYNALNTIQSFIFSDDKRNASTYLVKLSRLTRMILQMSEKESVTLDEETDALQLYLELEKMRFTENFNYEIFTGADVDTEMVKIPPMIVQPYVENAIKHGLLHKKEDRHLSITFLKENNILQVTIDDNGIGREKAAELNNIRKDKPNSFSSGANSKRIDLLNKERKNNIGVVYIDKKEDNNMAVGTTVIISIPLI